MSATQKTQVVDKQFMPEAKEKQFQTVVVVSHSKLLTCRKPSRINNGLRV